METKVNIEKGKIVEGKEKVNMLFNSLDDGVYVISLIRINGGKTNYDYQKQYRAKLKKLGICTGNNEEDLHLKFKEKQNISSTTELNEAKWVVFLKDFDWWAYNFFNCILL